VRVQVESRLPASLPVGATGAIFCFGYCFHVSRRVLELELLIGGVRHRPSAARMPRPDLYEWLRGGEDPHGHSYRSGWWATVPLQAPDTPGTLELAAAVRVAGDERSLHPLGRIEIVAPANPVVCESLAPGTIGICMATFDPDPELLRAQLDSLRAQTDERWICLISDGGSEASRFAQLLGAVGRDRRFVVSRSERPLGPYENFERALAMLPVEAGLVAFCDQDDRWYPDKLAVLRAALDEGEMVFSDQRLVADDGRVLRESLWEGRRNDHQNLASLLIANTVPGAATLFRRQLLELALPFPVAPGVPYHDHWIALVALASGEIRYVDRPLYDFIQHAGATSGGAVPSALPPGSRGWRGAYFAGYVMRKVLAQTLLMRCASRLTPRKRRALLRFIASERRPLSFLWLALRPLRRLVGRGETLGGESSLALGIAWRWLIVLAVGRAERPGRRAYDAAFPDPPRFEQRRLRRWRAGA
jgi:glycosyltransferase involved in cell wall biosynthesis